jgi:hypothetical protein
MVIRAAKAEGFTGSLRFAALLLFGLLRLLTLCQQIVLRILLVFRLVGHHATSGQCLQQLLGVEHLLIAGH